MKFTEENADAILAEINKKCSPYNAPCVNKEQTLFSVKVNLKFYRSNGKGCN